MLKFDGIIEFNIFPKISLSVSNFIKWKPQLETEIEIMLFYDTNHFFAIFSLGPRGSIDNALAFHAGGPGSIPDLGKLF